jgi:isoamylase
LIRLDRLRPGRSFPLGATFTPEGVNFCVFSKNCTAVELLLFDRMDQPRPAQVIALDPDLNRTFYYWHVLVPGLKSGQLYGYRVYGPHEPAEGNYFDGAKVLLDPYAQVVSYGANYRRDAACRPGDNAASAMKSVLLDHAAYAWEGDVPLERPLAEAVIYEMHVRGFTRHPQSGVAASRRGTYAGLMDKIPYLRDLGITAVELMPVQQFDEQAPGAGRKDYWGYNPIGLFAPHRGYSSRQDVLGPADEFRDMVKALHRAGIEVILDVVFNHTAEGDERGPTLCFRGLENRAYYIPLAGRAGYANYSGCGNTLNGNQSNVRRLIMDCLRHWVVAMHVDGFRFDLASVLARDESGQPLANPPILWEIEADPVLAGTKIIAEAWDAAGLYQVGRFVGHRWAEWNGQFRDDVRRFVRGDAGTVTRLAARLRGSPDLFATLDRQPQRSINFITCHDGFTLRDLVSYNTKHNEANRENNRDGSDANWSWNCGVEGPTEDAQILNLRKRQMKNLWTILTLAQGTPMVLMGDEVGHSQGGNNNAYSLDNLITWFPWTGLTHGRELLRFIKGLIRFRKNHAVFRFPRFWTTDAGETAPRITWHGVRPGAPDWGQNSHSLAFTVASLEDGGMIYALCNAYWETLPFELPAPPQGKRWARCIDTALPEPQDLAEPDQAPLVAASPYQAQARSVVVLWAK